MAEFLGELVLGLFQAAVEGMFGKSRSRGGCLLSLAAGLSLLGAIVCLVAGIGWGEAWGMTGLLLGLAVFLGSTFVVLGIAAGLSKDR